MSADCKKCNRAVRSNPIMCKGGCSGVFHQNCLELTDFDVNMIISNKNVIIVCDNCQLKMHSVEKLYDSMEIIKNSVASNKFNIEKILQQINKVELKDHSIIGEIKKVVSNCNTSNKQPTFANVVKGDPAIIVKPKNKQSADKTKKDIVSNIDPVGIKVTKMKNQKSGAIIVACENQESLKKLKNDAEINLSDNYSVDEVKNKNPRIVICNISDQMSDSDLIKALKLQNEFLADVEIIVKSMKKSNFKKYNPYSAVIEVNFESYNDIMKIGKLRVGWDKCIVKDAAYVKRCYKCLGFNHTSSVCTYPEKACFKCSGNHVGKDCAEAKESCINCMKINRELNLKLDYNHNAFDKNCEVYQRKLSIEKQKYY